MGLIKVFLLLIGVRFADPLNSGRTDRNVDQILASDRTDRQTDRQTDRKTEGQTERQKDAISIW